MLVIMHLNMKVGPIYHVIVEYPSESHCRRNAVAIQYNPESMHLSPWWFFCRAKSI